MENRPLTMSFQHSLGINQYVLWRKCKLFAMDQSPSRKKRWHSQMRTVWGGLNKGTVYNSVDSVCRTTGRVLCTRAILLLGQKEGGRGCWDLEGESYAQRAALRGAVTSDPMTQPAWAHLAGKELRRQGPARRKGAREQAPGPWAVWIRVRMTWQASGRFPAQSMTPQAPSGSVSLKSLREILLHLHVKKCF